MSRAAKILLILLACFAYVPEAPARRIIPPPEDGKVVIANHPKAGAGQVVFDHWVHRSRYTCRLCHVDIGFAMSAGGTEISAAANSQGLYCGVCHNGKKTFEGKKIFASCLNQKPGNNPECAKCHQAKKNADREQAFREFAASLPKKGFGNGIDWEAAESSGLIKPIDFIEGLSISRPSIKPQKDISIEAKVSWISDVIFSHKKHAFWNGCETCHPEIFPVKKGAMKYSMLDIDGGQFCGVCHDKVAFPLVECNRCHSR